MKIRNKVTGEIKEVSPNELSSYGLSSPTSSNTPAQPETTKTDQVPFMDTILNKIAPGLLDKTRSMGKGIEARAQQLETASGGIAEPLRQIKSLQQGISQNPVYRETVGSFARGATGVDDITGKENTLFQKPQTPIGQTMQVLGAGTELFNPYSATSKIFGLGKAPQLAKEATLAEQLASKIVPTIQRGAVGAAYSGSREAFQPGSTGSDVAGAAALGGTLNAGIPLVMDAAKAGIGKLRGPVEKPLIQREQQVAELQRRAEQEVSMAQKGLKQKSLKVAEDVGMDKRTAIRTTLGDKNVKFATQENILAETDKGIDLVQTGKNAKKVADSYKKELSKIIEKNPTPIYKRDKLIQELTTQIQTQNLTDPEKQQMISYVKNVLVPERGLKPKGITLLDLQNIKERVPYTDPSKNLTKIQEAENSLYGYMKGVIEDEASLMGKDVEKINKNIQSAHDILNHSKTYASPEKLAEYKSIIKGKEAGLAGESTQTAAKIAEIQKESEIAIKTLKDSNLPPDAVSTITGLIASIIPGVAGATFGGLPGGVGGLAGGFGTFKLGTMLMSNPSTREGIVRFISNIQKSSPEIATQLSKILVRGTSQ